MYTYKYMSKWEEVYKQHEQQNKTPKIIHFIQFKLSEDFMQGFFTVNFFWHFPYIFYKKTRACFFKAFRIPERYSHVNI